MDRWYVHFPVSGVDVCLLLPPLAAFAISAVTSMGGVSGAVLLLPFQVSILGFTSPSASATNFVYNIVAIPGGLWCYARERRMAWPLAWIIAAGTLPGVLIGFHVRVRCLPDPRAFKLFAGCALLCFGMWLLLRNGGKAESARDGGLPAGLPPDAVVRTASFSLRRAEIEFRGERFPFSVPGVFALALAVGVFGGIYGVGGGAIIAPVCVAAFGLPIHAVAGAALAGTFLTSVAGVVVYGAMPVEPGIAVRPDWLLGLLFGAGGLAGTYAGARLQRYASPRFLRAMLGLILLGTALQYIHGFLR